MDIKEYKKVFDAHQGVIKLADFTTVGFHNTVLDKLIKQGYVERIKAGYYEWIYEEPISDAVIITKLFPEGVICLESALYLYGYSDKTPLAWHVAVSKNKTKSKYKIDYPLVKFYFIIDSYMEIGKSEIGFEGHTLTIFDRERTICDIIRYEKKLDKELFNKAIKSYVKDSKKNIGRLMEYAEQMNVKKKVNTIIGMWM